MAPRPHSSQPLRSSSDGPPYDPYARSRERRESSYRDGAASSSPFQDHPPVSAGTSRYAERASQHGRQESYDSRRQSQMGGGGGGRRYEDEEQDGYGHEEERGEGWDVYADFNNAGPRYSTAPLTPGISSSSIAPARGPNDRSSKSYRPISAYGEGQPIMPSGPNHSNSNYAASTKSGAGMGGPGSAYGGKAMSAAQLETSELVTVPVLGADWKRSELHSLSKQGKKEAKAEERDRKWKRFKRDEDRKCCGWSVRQVLVWGVFISAIAIGLTLYFVIPRVPSFEWDSTQPIQAVAGGTNTSDTILFSRIPANFTFPALVSLQADTDSSYIPVHLTSLDAKVYDLDTNRMVANGTWTGTFKAKSQTPFKIPVTFAYAAINASDTTWLDFYNACAHIYPGTVRPTLNIRLGLSTKIAGRPGSSGLSTQISFVECPYELPSNSA